MKYDTEQANVWGEIESLFNDVLEQPLELRAEFLAERAGDRTELRQTVERLLKAHTRTDGFLENPAIGPGFELPPPELLTAPGPARRIGPYQLLRPLGSGGVAHVWLANRVDGQFDKLVAVKLIKRGLDTDAILDRFRRERQVLARLEHASIARLLDGGTTDEGLPYLAMEYVDGVRIDEYCQDRRLTVRQRLELFCHILSAVQYAHQNLVIHRDLKPGNILVTGDGQPKLLDFGIAKVLAGGEGAEASATSTGEGRLLTPEYASPEQIRGDPITTASDVYSLGVVLYELLTTRMPYDLSPGGQPLDSMILHAEPTRPSTRVGRIMNSDAPECWPEGEPRRLIDALRGDLDTILLKSLRMEPCHRYATVGQFAEDIRRFLEGQSVLARPQTLLYRTRKLLARNRIASATGFVALLALVLAVVVSTRFAFSEMEQRSLAELRLREAETQTAIAGAINRFLNEDVLAAAGPDRLANRDTTLRSVLDLAGQQIGHRFADQPQVEAAIRTTLGTTYRSLGEYGAAEIHLQRAFDLLSRSSMAHSMEALQVKIRLGDIKGLRGNLDEAESVIQQGLSEATSQLGAEDPVTLEAMHALAEILKEQGRLEEAEQQLRQTVKLRQRVLGAEHNDTLHSLDLLGFVLVELGRFAEAEELHRRIVEARIKTVGPDHPTTVVSWGSLGYALLLKGDTEAAEPILIDAIERGRRILGPDHPSTLAALDNLGRLNGDLNRLDEAERILTEAHQGRVRKLGQDHPDTLTSLNNLGVVYLDRGEYAKGERIYAEITATNRRLLGNDHPYTLTALNNLGFSVLKQGRSAEAESLFAEVVEGRRRAVGPEHPDTLGSISSLVKSMMDQGRFPEALPVISDAVLVGERVLPPNHLVLGILFSMQGKCQADLHAFDDAKKSLTRAATILASALGGDHPRTVAVIERIEAIEKERLSAREEASAP